jgi:uncharacterized protein (DUF697 family)
MADTHENQATEQAEQSPAVDQNHEEAAKAIINKYMGWGTSAGIIPLPVWDIVAIGSVQVMMLKELYALYGVTFNEKKARSAVTLLLGSLSPQLLVGAVASTFLKFVPGIGAAMASVSLPLLACASTYGVGRVMVDHLEQGGNLEDFDGKSNKEKFQQAVEKGKNLFKSKKEAASAETETTATTA